MTLHSECNSAHVNFLGEVPTLVIGQSTLTGAVLLPMWEAARPLPSDLLDVAAVPFVISVLICNHDTISCIT